jgi:hypothetical protein
MRAIGTISTVFGLLCLLRRGLVSKSVLFLSLELCRQSVADALQEIILAYQQQSKVIPLGKSLIKHIPAIANFTVTK